jgi:hypothetical protein
MMTNVVTLPVSGLNPSNLRTRRQRRSLNQ